MSRLTVWSFSGNCCLVVESFNYVLFVHMGFISYTGAVPFTTNFAKFGWGGGGKFDQS
jgi:hypothetical protein